MTNSWAMLFDHITGGEGEDHITYGSSDEELICAAGFVPMAAPYCDDVITFNIEEPTQEVVITDEAKTALSGKDATFWKYSEGKILREVEAYLSSTYKGHYVGEETKIQTLDLIESIGDAEAFCRSNAIKYLSRFGKKDGKNPKDLLKVIHYAFLLYHFSELPFTEDAKETFSATGR